MTILLYIISVLWQSKHPPDRLVQVTILSAHYKFDLVRKIAETTLFDVEQYFKINVREVKGRPETLATLSIQNTGRGKTNKTQKTKNPSFVTNHTTTSINT